MQNKLCGEGGHTPLQNEKVGEKEKKIGINFFKERKRLKNYKEKRKIRDANKGKGKMNEWMNEWMNKLINRQIKKKRPKDLNQYIFIFYQIDLRQRNKRRNILEILMIINNSRKTNTKIN